MNTDKEQLKYLDEQYEGLLRLKFYLEDILLYDQLVKIQDERHKDHQYCIKLYIDVRTRLLIVDFNRTQYANKYFNIVEPEHIPDIVKKAKKTTVFVSKFPDENPLTKIYTPKELKLELSFIEAKIKHNKRLTDSEYNFGYYHKILPVNKVK